ncbi:uncharacterized protein LOC110888797 [Helianthus annuus]|uniref:uncharacterized protein LOC110888797 n=1 Tax=Helianthus annuus TaxID=4232 RepID=UPI000B900115|nr:uncharacterized protein LOC110888797 [Helianthus annuus]
MAEYCQHMKLLYDQLISLGSTVSENQLVLQILTGLTDQCESISLILQQTLPLPDFYNTRSRLCQVEDRKTAQAKLSAQSAGTALHATTEPACASPNSRTHTRTNNNSERGRGRGRGRGRSSYGRGGRYQHQQNYWPPPPPWYSSQPPMNYWTQWTPPPCPYPSNPSPTNAPSPQPSTSAQGLLGPKPAASSTAQTYATGYSLTDIAQALYNLALLNNDSSWTMDTGASGNNVSSI